MRKSTRLAAMGLALAGVIGLSSAANAADIYHRGGSLKDEPGPAIFPTWAGLYVGGSVGYGWGDVSNDFTFCDLDCKDSDNMNGVVYGGRVGYNFQRGDIVFGAEASFNGTNMDGTTFDGDVKDKLDWYGTAVGRLGYAYGDMLFYGFGGVAWGNVKTTVLGDDDDATHVGWTAGAGVERAITDRFSVRLEYSHVDLGSETVFKNSDFEDKVDASFNAVTVGVNYKLTGERPLESLK